MNFVIVPTKTMAREERHDGYHKWYSSAYSINRTKAKLMSILSFGKVKVIEAENGTEAADKIKAACGQHGYVKNMSINFHSDDFGRPSTSGRSMEEAMAPGSPMSSLSDGYIGEGSKVLLGNCWAGGNASVGQPDYTPLVNSAFDGATVYGSQAAGSSFHFLFFNTPTGQFPECYSMEADNVSKIGMYSVCDGRAQLRRTTHMEIRLSHWGDVKEGPRLFNPDNRKMPALLMPFKPNNCNTP